MSKSFTGWQILKTILLIAGYTSILGVIVGILGFIMVAGMMSGGMGNSFTFMDAAVLTAMCFLFPQTYVALGTGALCITLGRLINHGKGSPQV